MIVWIYLSVAANAESVGFFLNLYLKPVKTQPKFCFSAVRIDKQIQMKSLH